MNVTSSGNAYKSEVSRTGDPRVIAEIRTRFGEVRLPKGPTGVRGLEREYRRFFASAEAGALAKMLYRGLCFPEHRADALWFLNAHVQDEMGLTAREFDTLRKFSAIPLREREERKVMITASILGSQRDVLDRMGGNLSATLRDVIESGLAGVVLSSEHRAYLATIDPDASKALAIVLDAAMGVST